jgi:hypothetical protein
VHRLREAAPFGVEAGGVTETFIDQSKLVSGRLPLFVGRVVLLSFLVLLGAFCAPVIALKAGVMNRLSIGAAYGVLALAAEGGWFGKLVGIDHETPVPPFMPVKIFAVLFGLSMDYEVFLLSRVREEYLANGQTVSEGSTRPSSGICCVDPDVLCQPLLAKPGEHVVEPARDPPVGAADELHHRRDEHHPHERRVGEDRRRQADAHQLENDIIAEQEGEEDGDHDGCCGRNHTRRLGEPGGDGALAPTAGASPR